MKYTHPHDKQLKDDKKVAAAIKRVLTPLQNLRNMNTLEITDSRLVGELLQKLETLKGKYEIHSSSSFNG